jgi:hypothetical protein
MAACNDGFDLGRIRHGCTNCTLQVGYPAYTVINEDYLSFLGVILLLSGTAAGFVPVSLAPLALPEALPGLLLIFSAVVLLLQQQML